MYETNGLFQLLVNNWSVSFYWKSILNLISIHYADFFNVKNVSSAQIFHSLWVSGGIYPASLSLIDLANPQTIENPK